MPTLMTVQATTVVSGARATTLLPENYQTATQIRVVDGPDHGRLTVNPDNTLALVMTESDHTGPLDFTIEVTNSQGVASQQTYALNVTEPSQQSGWGTGANHYMLETDADGDLVIETGDVHREVYVSGAPGALSLADIAAREGLSVSQITGGWLADNPEYGASPDLALDMDAGMALWGAISGGAAGPQSNWLRFEAGYTYATRADEITVRGIEGESPLHPSVITSYGDGPQPIISGTVHLAGEAFNNVVFHDVHFVDEVLLEGSSGGSGNVIFDSTTSTEQGNFVVQFVDGGVTIRDAEFYNLTKRSPVDDDGQWNAVADRISAVYVFGVDGLLIEDTTISRVGWEPGYDYNRSSAFPQAPSMFSHAVYIDNINADVTFRDNVIAQASSLGAQVRSGGFVEDNLFIDNNIGLNVLGGDYEGAGAIGQYSLINGNVISEAGYRDAVAIGALAKGIENGGVDSTLTNNIVAHLADPNNPGEVNERYVNNDGLFHRSTPYYDDTIVYNWHGGYDVEYGQVQNREQNVGDLDRDVLNQTTVDNLAELLLNDPNAGPNELAEWMWTNDVEADELNAYFQEAFGILAAERTVARELRFVPNELADGVRWDNRLNWDTEDLPGTVAGDSVDLGGNLVVFGGTVSLSGLDFGSGGRLDASHGRLNVLGQTEVGAAGAEINISAAGQVWLNGYSGTPTLDVFMDGGRFANFGTMNGSVNVTVEAGQALLGANGGDFRVGANSALFVGGGDARAGFDGDDGALSVLRFANGADVTIASDSSGLGFLGEFRSGAFGNAPDIDTLIDLDGADLTIDLSQAWLANGTYEIMAADMITGDLESFSVIGLGSRAGTLTIDYDSATVLFEAHSGNGLQIETIGMDDAPAVDDDAGGNGGPGPQPNPNPDPVPDPDPQPDPVPDPDPQPDPVPDPDPQPDPVPDPEPAPDPQPNPGPTTAGLSAAYFALPGMVSSLDSIDWNATPTATGSVDSLAYRGGAFWDGGPQDLFAAQYTGALQIATPGDYTFYLTSDDGSRLTINGQTVIDNDGLHAALELSVTVFLDAGSHDIGVQYFEIGGGEVLELEWAGPETGGARTLLTDANMTHGSGVLPSDPEPAPEPDPEPNPVPDPEPADPEPVPNPAPDPQPDPQPQPGAQADPGINAAFYVLDDWVNSVTEVDWTAPADATGTVGSLGYSGGTPFWDTGPGDYFAAWFTGYLQIETSGDYTFYLTSDDGSVMSIDSATVIDNDGLHATRESSVTLFLDAGEHAIDVQYFEIAGAQVLELDWAGPDTNGARTRLTDEQVTTVSALVPNDGTAGSQEAEVFEAADGSVEFDGAGGADSIYGGLGEDTLFGGSESDLLLGGASGDVIIGESGRDTLLGESGDDLLDGGRGDDWLDGGRGEDTLDGGRDDDIMFGGRGHDSLDGGIGNDVLSGGRGRDTLTGGEGADDFLFLTWVNGGGGINSVTDFVIGEDLIDVSDYGVGFNSLTMSSKAWGSNIVFEDGQEIRLENVDISSVTADLFIF